MIPARIRCGVSLLGLSVVLGCGDDRDAARVDSLRAHLAVTCGRAADAVISARGIGRVRIGSSLAEVGAVCPVADTGTVETRRDPAERSVPLRIEDRLMLLRVSRDTIVGISTADAAFRTDRGVGVGSQLRTLRFAYGPLCAFTSTDGPTIQVERLDGIAFDVGSLPQRLEPGVVIPLPPDSLSDQSRITRVRVGRIPSRCAAATPLAHRGEAGYRRMNASTLR